MKTRIRELANGKFIAEVRGFLGWKAIWQAGMVGKNGSTYAEYRWDFAYRLAMQDTEEKARLVLNDYRANWGY